MSRPCIRDLGGRVRQAFEEDVGRHSFNKGDVMGSRHLSSPGQLQEGILTVLLLWVGGFTVVLVKVGRHRPRANPTRIKHYE